MWALRALQPQRPVFADTPCGRGFWVRAAVVALVVGVGALGVAAASARGLDDLPTLHATFSLCWCVIALASGSAMYLRWRITGEAPVGLLAAAVVVMALPQLPLAVVDLAADPSESARRLAPITRVAVMLPAGWLLVRCALAPAVDDTLNPLGLVRTYTGIASVCPVAVLGAQFLGVTPASAALAPSTAGYVLVALTAGLAWLFTCRRRSIPAPLGTVLLVVLSGTAASVFTEVLARRWIPSLLVPAGLLTMLCIGLLMFVAVSSLRSSLDSARLRQQVLRRRAEAAEAAVQREQERLHELRSTAAGIRQASGTLRQYGEHIEPRHRQHLREMMAEEASRLERMLAPGNVRAELHVAVLDDIVRPVVLSHREQGTDVRWHPTGTRVLVRGDEIAEVLDILLVNAREHAPGSTVELTVTELPGVVRMVVRDHGPGVPHVDARRLFDRGVRRAGSSGDGLGLHIGHRLAAESGGALTLLSSEGHGARFALTMPAGSAVPHLPGQPMAPLQEAR